MKTDLRRTVPNKPILFIDFDQTMTSNDDQIDSIIDTFYKLESEKGEDIKRIKKLENRICSQEKLGMYNFFLAVCQNNMNDFNQLCQEIFNRIDYSSIKKNENLINIMIDASKKFDLYILTNNPRIHIDKALKKLFGIGINDAHFIKCFDILETYYEGKFWGKQMNGALEMACERVGATINECTLIDDMESNINIAQRIGMNAILVTNENKLSDILVKLLH